MHYHFVDSTTYGLGPFTYIWLFGDDSSAHTATATHTYIEPNTYTVSLIVSDICGSDTITHIIQVSTGIETADPSNPIHLHPNPNTGTLTLTSDQHLTGSYYIYDMLGNLIATQPITSTHQLISLTDVPAGVYTLLVRDLTTNRALRFIIAR
jgi:PKD repeat protein